MKSNITINFVKENEEFDSSQGNFMVNDLAGAMKDLGLFVPIACINSYDGSQKEKEEILSSITSLFDSAGNRGENQYVLCTTAYISTSEFPESEWQISEELSKKENKKLIPVNEILNREIKLLEDIGWLDINKYVGYENKHAFIYSNALGRLIKNYLDEINR